MKITNQQLVNPGVLDASEKHKKQFKRYKVAVGRAKFLSDQEKRHWTMLGYLLTSSQLLEAERTIISEDLRQLKVRQKLERIKPKPKKNGG